MSTYRLKCLFAPRAIAVVGASPRERSLGRVVLGNLRAAGFKGPIQLVNPRYADIDGQATVPSIDALDQVPDLMIVTAPAAEVPDLIAKAGARGIGAAIVITAGLGHGPGSLAEQARQAARAHGLRMLGPNCLGLFVPSARLKCELCRPSAEDRRPRAHFAVGRRRGGARGMGRRALDRLFRNCVDRRRARHRSGRKSLLTRRMQGFVMSCSIYARQSR